MSNMKYWLDFDGNVQSQPATEAELEGARKPADAKVEADWADYAMRSCWLCNPAHSRFLEDLDDGFLFVCFDCGHWYYQGMDITLLDDKPESE